MSENDPGMSFRFKGLGHAGAPAHQDSDAGRQGQRPVESGDPRRRVGSSKMADIYRTKNLKPWPKGVSGSPGGRPKRKPVTEALQAW